MNEENAEFMKAFVSEAKEDLYSIKDALTKLEKSPSDADLVVRLYRAFHTFKGNSAAMGFNNLSELSKHLEKYLEVLKNEKIVPTKEIYELILSGVKGIDSAMGKIEAEGNDTIDFSELFSKLSKVKPNNP